MEEGIPNLRRCGLKNEERSAHLLLATNHKKAVLKSPVTFLAREREREREKDFWGSDKEPRFELNVHQ